MVNAFDEDAIYIGTPGTCTVTVSGDFQSTGPVTAGFLGLSVTGGADGNGGAYDAELYINGALVGHCFFFCEPILETIPFTLGVPLEITAVAVGSAESPSVGGGAAIQATLSFYQTLDGPAEPIYSYCPETGTFALTLFAGVGGAAYLQKRKMGRLPGSPV